MFERTTSESPEREHGSIFRPRRRRWANSARDILEFAHTSNLLLNKNYSLFFGGRDLPARSESAYAQWTREGLGRGPSETTRSNPRDRATAIRFAPARTRASARRLVAHPMENTRRRVELSSFARLDSDSKSRRSTKTIDNLIKSLFIGERSDSRTIRFDPQIASSGETKEIAFDGRYRQKRLLVTSARDARVRSTVFRRRFDGARSSCRQQQSRASADHPHREGLRRGTLTGRMGVRPSSTSQQGELLWRNGRKQRKRRARRSTVSSVLFAS